MTIEAHCMLCRTEETSFPLNGLLNLKWMYDAPFSNETKPSAFHLFATMGPETISTANTVIFTPPPLAFFTVYPFKKIIA